MAGMHDVEHAVAHDHAAGARRRAEERNTLLKEALEELRTAGAKLEPMMLPEFPANALGFISYAITGIAAWVYLRRSIASGGKL